MRARREPERTKARARWRHVSGKANSAWKKTSPATKAAVTSTIASVCRRPGPSTSLDSPCLCAYSRRDRACDLHPPAAPRSRGLFRLDGRPPGSMAGDDAARSGSMGEVTMTLQNRTACRTRRRPSHRPAPTRARTTERPGQDARAYRRRARPIFPVSPGITRSRRGLYSIGTHPGRTAGYIIRYTACLDHVSCGSGDTVSSARYDPDGRGLRPGTLGRI